MKKRIHPLHAHLKKHHKKYLLGIFGSFAVVKTILLFAGFFGLSHLGNVFAGSCEPTMTIPTTCDSYTWNDVSYSFPGNYMDSNPICDPEVRMLTLNEVLTTTNDTVFEFGASYVWHGTTYTGNGSYNLGTGICANLDLTLLNHTFVINDNDASTHSPDVTLKLTNAGNSYRARFQNDGTGGARSDRYTTRPDGVPLATLTTGRTLSPGGGYKIVYIEVDSNNDRAPDASSSDGINYTPDITGNIRLDITATSGTCTYGTSLYIGTHTAQFAAFEITGSNFPEDFECVDTEGLATWTMTMAASSDLTNGNVAQDIPKANVSMIVNNPQVVSAGTCTGGATDTTWVGIGGVTPGTILNKSAGINDICTLTASGVNLAVAIPASQAVGNYTGDLTLDMPF